MSWKNDVWLAPRGSSIDSFPLKMSPRQNRDNRELCYLILPCVHVNVNSSYTKSFVFNKLLPVAAPKTLQLQSIAYGLVSTWRHIGGGWRRFRGLACSTFQTCILNSH